MGLDMYLYAKRYVGNWNHTDELEKKIYTGILNAFGLTPLEDGAVEVQVKVAYWRKANQIHKWFVDNVQGGMDECQSSDVSRGQLQSLLNLCNQVFEMKGKTVDEITAALPPAEGFFFGSTEIDESYWEDILLTIEQLSRILKDPALQSDEWSFQYRASW